MALLYNSFIYHECFNPHHARVEWAVPVAMECEATHTPFKEVCTFESSYADCYKPSAMYAKTVGLASDVKWRISVLSRFGIMCKAWTPVQGASSQKIS